MSLTRRTVLVLIAVAISAVLLRAQISSALLTRGDTFAFYGAQSDARDAYARALLLDRDNAVAADRLVFALAFSKRRTNVERAVTIASRFLSSHPNDVKLLMDRALSLQHLGRLTQARADFVRAGLLARDPRALFFGALDASRTRDIAGMQRLLRMAVAFDPGFVPARRALERRP